VDILAKDSLSSLKKSFVGKLFSFLVGVSVSYSLFFPISRQVIHYSHQRIDEFKYFLLANVSAEDSHSSPKNSFVDELLAFLADVLVSYSLFSPMFWKVILFSCQNDSLSVAQKDILLSIHCIGGLKISSFSDVLVKYLHSSLIHIVLVTKKHLDT